MRLNAASTSKSIESLPDGGECVEYDADIWASNTATSPSKIRVETGNLARWSKKPPQ